MRDSGEYRILPETEQILKAGDGMRQARLGHMAERGVWIAPWLGPNGETILVTIDRHHRRVGGEELIPPGMNHVLIADQLWNRLDEEDPMPQLGIVLGHLA